MSSICGVVDFSSALVDFEAVRNMGKAMVLRGRDRFGAYINRGVVFQHNHMLKLGEQSVREPYTIVRGEGKYTIVLDGELYGFEDMLDILKTGDFSSDAEAVLECYIAFGYDCVNYFDGSYAFAIYDELHREVFFARDSKGTKPLYYLQDGKKLIFASEIKGLLRYLSEGTEIDKKAVSELIISPPGTVSASDVYKDICEFPSGYSAVYTALGLQMWRNQHLSIHKSCNPRKVSMTVEEYDISEICDDECRILSESLFAFDYPEFDEYMLSAISALDREKGKRALLVCDPSFVFGEEYALMRADRFGMMRAALLEVKPPERKIKIKHTLLSKTEKKLSLMAEKLFYDENSMIFKLFGNDFKSLAVPERRSESLIRMYAKILQTEMWLRDYRVFPD